MVIEDIQLRKIDENYYELDVRGMVCPFPQVLISKALKSLTSNEKLEVFIDNPPSVREIPLSLERNGYKVERTKVDENNWKLVVEIKQRQ
ncbi:MAG TPA: sulfurtransferase TusA family protein [bacterium]|nr:sulfurtransferase TusA family protein [bacterium]